jgi:hypothetical protein
MVQAFPSGDLQRIRLKVTASSRSGNPPAKLADRPHGGRLKTVPRHEVKAI